jgi:hypothetical protein
VTLILGLSRQEGIYLSVDYRLTLPTGDVVDDGATKHLEVHYRGGPRALIAYTGIAQLPDGTQTGSWIRETLRGQDDTFDASMGHLRDRLNRDYAGLGNLLMVNVLVIDGGRRYFGGMSNLRKDRLIQSQFGYHLEELTLPTVIGNGWAADTVAGKRQVLRIHRQLEIDPGHPREYMNLLAAVNRAIAEGSTRASRTVSPYCHVAFVADPGSDFESESKVFTRAGESVPFAFPHILLGIDLEVITQREPTGEGTMDQHALAVLNANLQRRP